MRTCWCRKNQVFQLLGPDVSAFCFVSARQLDKTRHSPPHFTASPLRFLWVTRCPARYSALSSCYSPLSGCAEKRKSGRPWFKGLCHLLKLRSAAGLRHRTTMSEHPDSSLERECEMALLTCIQQPTESVFPKHGWR